MSIYKEKDVQDNYRGQPLIDQHGREWFATIDVKTGDPCGPLDMVRPRKAPLIPPPLFLKVNSKKDYGKVIIDYTGWKAMQRRALDEYDRRLRDFANKMYGEAAPQKLEERPLPSALVAEVGIPPEPIERILAAEAGDPWVLGLSDVRPAWADKFFAPTRQVKRSATGEDLSFMEAPQGLDMRKVEKSEKSEFPQMYAPGRWRLSDGSTVQGKRADAESAENILKATGQHPSWGG